MRKVKRFFGMRRRWPDSPHQQKLKATYDIEAMSGVGNESYGIYEHIQSLECDLMVGLSKMAIPMLGLHKGSHRGGFRRGEMIYFSTPTPQLGLQALWNNVLRDNPIFCLEDSYKTHHHLPNYDFDPRYAPSLCPEIYVETPNDALRKTNR